MAKDRDALLQDYFTKILVSREVWNQIDTERVRGQVSQLPDILPQLLGGLITRSENAQPARIANGLNQRHIGDEVHASLDDRMSDPK
jgi:hypothetical protein